MQNSNRLPSASFHRANAVLVFLPRVFEVMLIDISAHGALEIDAIDPHAKASLRGLIGVGAGATDPAARSLTELMEAGLGAGQAPPPEDARTRSGRAYAMQAAIGL